MPKAPARAINLGEKPIMVGFQEYQGRPQFTLRYLYTDHTTGEQLPGKNGITMPADDLMEAIQLMLQAYNDEYAADLVIAYDPEHGDKGLEPL